MDDEFYENLESFFHEVFRTAPPGLTPQYQLAEVKVWQQLDREYPGGVDIQYQQFVEDGSFGNTFWHLDPAAKSYYKWLEDARDGKIMDPRKRRNELYSQMTPDCWRVADTNWKVSVLNSAISYGIESASDEQVLLPEDWFDYIRGKATLSASVSAKSNRPSYIYTNGDFFLLIQNQDVYVLTRPQIQESLKYFVKDSLLVATFAMPLLNWTINFPAKLFRR